MAVPDDRLSVREFRVIVAIFAVSTVASLLGLLTVVVFGDDEPWYLVLPTAGSLVSSAGFTAFFVWRLQKTKRASVG